MDNVDKTLSTDEIRQIIQDEMRQISASFVTEDEVNRIIKTQVDAVVNPAIVEMQAQFQQGMAGLKETINTRLANIESLIARLGEQSRNQGEWVKSMNGEQQRINAEQDEIKREQAKTHSMLIQINADVRDVVQDIWGTPERQGTGSVIETMNTGFKAIADQLGQKREEDKTFQQSLMDKAIQTDAKLETIESVVEENRQFRLKRQRIEKAFIQTIPNISKRFGTIAAEFLTSKAGAGVVGTGLGALIAFLREHLQ